MRQPRGLTFPEGSSPRAALARRQKTLHGALAETSSRGRRARDDEIRLRRLAAGTATNRVREPRRRISRARGSLSDLLSVPRAGLAWREARKDALGQAAMLSSLAGCGTARIGLKRPRRRTARATGALAGLAHVPPWLPPYARRSGRRHRRRELRP